jgi:prepilin-type N-terminal cleavage/methylation domain-containing protein
MMNRPIENPRLRHRKSSGFTLTELLVAMTLGLFIIGGALSVFLSSQETYRTKASLEASQEAIRFAAYTISRTVNSGASVTGDESKLVVAFDGGADIKDCLGEETSGSSSNTFSRSGTTLLCNNEPIVTGLSDTQEGFSVLYGQSADPSGWIPDEDYVERAEIDDMSSVRSVKVGILTPAGPVTFVASLKNKIVSDLRED